MDKRIKYAIIGNGTAGLNAAKAIRSVDPSGSILMISSEGYLTYYRLKLSHLLGTHVNDKAMLLHDENWYKDMEIEVLLNTIVEAIQPSEHQLLLDDGSVISYEKCLLANGSKPFVPPVAGKFKQGVFAVRTLKDLHYMEDYLASRDTVTIIGGGILGLESAASLLELGKKVNVIEFFPYLLPRQLDEALSRTFEEALKEKGLNIFTGEEVEEILGDDEAKGIRLKSGKELESGAVIFSSGIRPSTELAVAAGLRVNKGVVVDAFARASHDDVYAAGDVAEFDGVNLGLWSASTEQGRAAGLNMAGKQTEYHLSLNHTQTNILGIPLFSVGDISNPDEVIEETNDQGGTTYKLFIKNSVVVGGILFGDTSLLVKMKRLIVSSPTVDDMRRKGTAITDILT